jgi:hypothetical protein
MRRLSLLAALLSGCLHHAPYVSFDGASLGRVVIYRNGVAFYERRATVIDGKLAVHVPRERVDDFLKSLTVVDPATKKPLSVSIPRQEDGTNLTMTIETGDRQRADVLLTYVTEAPAWKPSYRVVVGPTGKVMFEGWAIVDNMSGEDWKSVKVGVGASSALAFRYDLWSVRRVDRDLLQGDEKFAVAPPTGVSPYTTQGDEVLGEIADAAGVSFSGSTSLENQYYADGVNTTGLTTTADTGSIQGVITDKRTGEKLAGVSVVVTSPALGQSQSVISDDQGSYRLSGLPAGVYLVEFFYADEHLQLSGVAVAKQRVTPLYQQIDESKAGGEVVKIEAKAPTIDPTSTKQSITIEKNYIKNIPVPGRTFDAALGSAPGSQADSRDTAPPKPTLDLRAIATKATQAHKDVLIETHGDPKPAIAIRDQLVDAGLRADRVHVVTKPGPGGLRVLAIAPGEAAETSARPAAHASTSDTPVGESHFMTDRPLTVRAGASAMVSMVHSETTGGIVYLFDPISDRGDHRFAFKAVRLDNPTSDTLEPGPMTVYGDDRFIGEGITEPVPPHASVVVPFALDKQIVVTTSDADTDRIAKLETVQRGVIRAEVQHRRQTRFIVTSRLDQPAKVYLRHRLQSDWTLVDAPPRSLQLGDSQLFEVDVAPHETQYVSITEATPIDRTLDLASPDTLEMMKGYVDDPEASPALRAQIEALVATHQTAAELDDKIKTLHDQLAEYREREGELHAQVVSLRAVRTGGDLMTALKTKLGETNDRIQKATIAVVDAQEQLMLLRVKFQNQLADLHLTDLAAVGKH